MRNGKRLYTIQVGAGGRTVAVDPTTGHMLVVNNYENLVSVLAAP